MEKLKSIRIRREDYEKILRILLEEQYKRGMLMTIPDVIHMIVEFYIANKEKLESENKE